jgi:transposase
MSTSLLYHAFGIRGYRYQRAEFHEGGVVFTIEQDREHLCCSDCGGCDVTLRGKSERSFRAPPIGGRTVTVNFAVPRVGCLSCGSVRRVAVSFAEGQRQHTKSFERYVLELSRLTTILDVARHLGVSWDFVKEVQKRDLMRRFSRPKLSGLRLIAIDEIAVRKGHRYLTVVLDLETGAVVFVGDGKGGEALEPFWRRLRRSRARLDAVAIDMSAAYARAVRTHVPTAVLVFDRFHVVKLVNEKLSDLRREVQRTAEAEEKKVLKGTRWLLLSNPENLDQEKGEPERLQAALDMNAPLAAAYYLKEDLRLLWGQASKSAAEKYFEGWLARARGAGVSTLAGLADTLDVHREGILAWYDHRITTGPLEGTNNKIKVLKRTAYGFRDTEFFKLKILALHESRQALVG